MNYQRVQEFISVSLEVLPRKLKKFENSQTSGGTFLKLSDNLQRQKNIFSNVPLKPTNPLKTHAGIHTFTKLPRLDTN